MTTRYNRNTMRKAISWITDVAIFVIGMPIVGFAYFVVDPLIAYYDRVKIRRKGKAMRKSLMILLILIIAGCASVMPAKASEPIKTDLETFCNAKAALIQNLLYEVVDANRQLHGMIREDTADFVPVLFAQFKMESLSIMLFSTMVEVLRTAADGEVFNITSNLLDQYIELVRYDLIKAKLFEGMIGDPDSWWSRSRDQLILKMVAVHLKVGHDLLVDIKKGLEELK